MAKVIIWKAGPGLPDYVDGHIRITRGLMPLLPGETESQYLDRVAADAISKDPTLAGFTRVADLEESALPARTHRPHWRFNAGAVAPDQSLIDAAAIADNLAARELAKTIFLAVDAAGKRDKAIVLVLKDEINSLRDWITQFKAEVAAATSLANLQTRVAGLPNLPQRTNAQAKAAISSKLDTGDAD